MLQETGRPYKSFSFIFITYNEIPIPKRRICRADRCSQNQAGVGLPLPTITVLTPPGPWPLPRHKLRS